MIFDSLLSLIAPHECLGCMAEGALLCKNCQASLQAPIPRCYKCHAAGRGFVTCGICRAESALSSVHPAVRYTGVAKDLVWKLKFGRAQAAGREIARCMTVRLQLRRKLSGRTATGLIITHAPTATTRVRQRGYDQASLIARALSRYCGVTYRPLLRRRGNKKQVGASRAVRHAQLADAFYVVRPARLRGAHVILIDDVVTTGATLEAAAKVLIAAGARRVDAVVFAQA